MSNNDVSTPLTLKFFLTSQENLDQIFGQFWRAHLKGVAHPWHRLTSAQCDTRLTVKKNFVDCPLTFPLPLFFSPCSPAPILFSLLLTICYGFLTFNVTVHTSTIPSVFLFALIFPLSWAATLLLFLPLLN